ncbi:hypothetical protein [Nonomuraea wenchangensis]|uniref:hypothetical protein n=1 Tax=Nonomuraea wenchangensis TaxID=568860 RepID=UPI00332E7550
MVVARTFRTPLFLISGAVVLALAGWWQYQAAIPSFPVVAEPGTVGLIIFGPAHDVEITLRVSDGSSLAVEVLATFDPDEPARPAIPASRCVPMRVYHSVDRPSPPRETELCPPAPSAGRYRAAGGASFTVADPMVARSGSSTVVRMPRVSPTWFGTDWDYKVVYEGSFDRTGQDAEDQLKPEAVSPDYGGPGLRWVREQLRAPTQNPEPGPYGTFTDVPAEKAASRSLFWAGLLGGAALSVLAWAGDLGLARRAERRREQERRAEEEAHRREIADLAAQRVLAALAERENEPPGGLLRRVARWAGQGMRR